MALELKVNPVIVSNEDCSSLQVIDGTGTYAAGTNEGGYGAPNPERNTLALVLRIITYTTAGAVDTDVIQLEDDPVIITEFGVSVSDDRYYQFSLVTTPVWNNVDAYLVGTIVYYNQGIDAENGFYRCIANSTNNTPVAQPSFWEVVEDPSEIIPLIGVDVNINTSANEDYLFKCNLQQCYLKLSEQIATDILNSNNLCDTSDEFKSWQELHLLYNSVLILEQNEKYIEAQKTLEYTNEVCVELDCDCGC